ncbi:MAG: class IV adenylate cyclase [Planctomycetota bacterium]
MPLELEAKVRVDDHEPVRTRLVDAGATRVKRVHEVNTYLRLDDPYSGLRVRHETDEAGKARVRVTYKGPRQPGKFKQREEIEYDASEADAAIALFGKLGREPSLVFEKDRETFTLDGCEVVLDHIEQLGHFVEVEGPDEATVIRVLQTLNLDRHESLTEGYASMLARA